MDTSQALEAVVAASASDDLRPKRKVRRRTFKQIRAEERAVIAEALACMAERVRDGRVAELVL